MLKRPIHTRKKTHAAAADCCGAKNQNFFYFFQHGDCLLQMHADSQQILWPSEWALIHKPICLVQLVPWVRGQQINIGNQSGK